jgi:hypothetical protein
MPTECTSCETRYNKHVERFDYCPNCKAGPSNLRKVFLYCGTCKDKFDGQDWDIKTCPECNGTNWTWVLETPEEAAKRMPNALDLRHDINLWELDQRPKSDQPIRVWVCLWKSKTGVRMVSWTYSCEGLIRYMGESLPDCEWVEGMWPIHVREGQVDTDVREYAIRENWVSRF